MNLKPFWDQLVEIEEIKIKIKEYGLREEEENELLDLTYQTFDLRVMETVLSHLPQEKHQRFLDTFSRKPHHPRLMAFLKEEIENIEEKIKKLARQVKKEILTQLESKPTDLNHGVTEFRQSEK